MTPQKINISEYAGIFWSRVGKTETCLPRQLEQLAPKGFNLIFVRLPNLSDEKILDWLDSRGIGNIVLGNMGAMKGGIVARKGAAVIFSNASQSEDEIRFTVAHEMAHYLIHYLLPREKTIYRLGEGITEVLDGFREPTDAERFGSVLKGVPIGLYNHMWQPEPDKPESQKEIEADLLAFELLAPRSLVLKYQKNGKLSVTVLSSEFGLPKWAAEEYCSILSFTSSSRRPGFADWLKE